MPTQPRGVVARIREKTPWERDAVHVAPLPFVFSKKEKNKKSRRHASSGKAECVSIYIYMASKEGPPGCNLFIYHLPPTWTDADLKQKFEGYGSMSAPPIPPRALARCGARPARDRAARNRSRPPRPERAMAAARGARRWRSARRVAISAARCLARLARASPNSARAPAPPPTHPPAYHALVSLTAQAGAPCSLSHIIMKDRATGLSKGFGFVSFNNPESARNAIQGK